VQRSDYTGEWGSTAEEGKKKPSTESVMPGITAIFDGDVLQWKIYIYVHIPLVRCNSCFFAANPSKSPLIRGDFKASPLIRGD
jgi:hypothetical protein